MKPFKVVAVAVVLLSLAGCAQPPSRAEIAERFLIEADLPTASDPETAKILDELATGIADDALEGKCRSDMYRAGLGDKLLIRAFNTTCLMYFEHEMSPEQIDAAKRGIIDDLTGD